ncbi:activator of hsp90 ATPase 1 family protein [Phlyctema vagabunda]|uniref:Activator of hsp90 ATPase 1 family protein n=1 Tax=Phlyctema vagabunda TaxID=108571 RepID=A0ABR4P3X6_9HELO
MPKITTIVNISRPPAFVREKFLDFSSIPKYKPTFLLGIESLDKKQSSDLRPGDGVKFTATMKGKVNIFEAKVASNSPEEFSWQGGLPLGLLKGVHTFHFESIDNGNGTKFIQEEVFSGPLSFIMGEGFLARLFGVKAETEAGYMGFNIDFRKWVENTEMPLTQKDWRL